MRRGKCKKLLRRNPLLPAVLSGKKKITFSNKKIKPKAFIKIVNAHENNLQNISVSIPIGVFLCNRRGWVNHL